MTIRECRDLTEVRSEIDRLDRQIVALLAERAGYVRQAARFKSSREDVPAPQRVEAVISKVRALAAEGDLDPAIVERVYREMIAAFIEAELREHERLQTDRPAV